MQNRKIGSGLHNLGNTCFFNAIMQVIFYTPALANYFNAKIHQANCSANTWCIFCALQKLWIQSKQNRVVSPNAIVSNLKSIFKKFRLGRQQDSHQFLRYLVEGMQEAETGKLGKDRQRNDRAIMKTVTYHTFGGRMRTFVLCLNCKQKSLTTQRYYDLSIQCQRSNSLVQGLENYFRVDDLTGSNKYRCDSCKQLSNAKKGFRIISIPSAITFQLKRFTNNLRKINKLVDYPKFIDFSRFMEDDTLQQKFELYGVVVHSGSSAGSGHYYAFVKNGSEWFEMNDSNVSRTNEQRVFKQQAYLLFYCRSHHERPIQTLTEHAAEDTQTLTNLKSKQNVQITIAPEQNKNKKDKNRKKSIQLKARKMSEQNIEQTKRKLSLDIQQLLQQTKQQSKKQKEKPVQKEMNDKKKVELEINGKRIFSPIFGEKPSFAQNNNRNGKQQKKKDKIIQHRIQQNKDQQNEDEDSLEVPKTLQRKRSKQQALSSMNLAELILRYSEMILNLEHKITRSGGRRSMRSLTNLRKFDVMTKRRKIG